MWPGWTTKVPTGKGCGAHQPDLKSLRRMLGGRPGCSQEPEQGCQHTGAGKRTKTGHQETSHPDQLRRPAPPPTRGQEVPSEIVPQLQAQSVGSRSFPEPTGGRVVKRQVDQVLPSRLTLTQTRVRCRCSGARPAGDKPAAGWRCGPWGGGLPPGLRCVCKLIWLCKAMTPRSTCASVPGACPYKQPPAGRLSKPSVLLLLHRRTVAGTAPALVPERI